MKPKSLFHSTLLVLLILTSFSCTEKKEGYYEIQSNQKEVYQFACEMPMSNFFDDILLGYTDPDMRSFIRQLEFDASLTPKKSLEQFNNLVKKK